jgi:hypothetical protein
VLYVCTIQGKLLPINLRISSRADTAPRKKKYDPPNEPGLNVKMEIYNNIFDFLAPLYSTAICLDNDPVSNKVESPIYTLIVGCVDSKFSVLQHDSDDMYSEVTLKRSHYATKPIFSSPFIMQYINSDQKIVSNKVVFGSHDGWLRCINLPTSIENNISDININKTSNKNINNKVRNKNEYNIDNTTSDNADPETSYAWEVDLGSVIFSSPIIIEIPNCNRSQESIKQSSVYSKLYTSCLNNNNAQYNDINHYNNYSNSSNNSSSNSSSNLNNMHLNNNLQMNKLTPLHVVIACTTAGMVHVISMHGQILAKKLLPAEIFSTPVAVNNSIYIGCRDDCVYGLQIII